MKSFLQFTSTAILAFVLGGACVYIATKHHIAPEPDEWIVVGADGSGIMTDIQAFYEGIPFPKFHQATGRVKFLVRDNGSELGYILKFPIDAEPTSQFPAKFLTKLKTVGGGELHPPDQLLLQGHFNFVLKDADGFVLLRISGPPEYLAANSDNNVQATVEESIPSTIRQRTKAVDVRFIVDSCTPCSPN